MVYEIPGIDLLFRMPYNNNDADMLAAAKAFLANAPDYEERFIFYGLPDTFINELQTAITAFENSLGAPGTAIAAQVEATAEIGEQFRKGMIARRILDNMVKTRYKNDVGKLAAWLSASHIERINSGEEPNQPTP